MKKRYFDEFPISSSYSRDKNMTYSLTRFVRPLKTSTWRQPIRFLDKSLQGTKDSRKRCVNSFNISYLGLSKYKAFQKIVLTETAHIQITCNLKHL